MKQFQLEYKNDRSFREELDEIKQWCSTNPSYTVLFRIYSEDMEVEHIKHVCDILDEEMPEALYLGCTTQGNIYNGVFAGAGITLSCTVFEYESTQVKLLQLPFSEESAAEAVNVLKKFCDDNPWVSSVEMYATILRMSVRKFCDEMNSLRSDIQVFGGGACNPNADDFTTIVFSKENGFSEHGIVFLLLGGSDFHTYSTYISGWKPLRRRFKITKAQGDILYELNGEPAFNIYQRFLKINRSDKLVTNTLEFPLLMDYNGIEVLRCPLVANDDNSLAMTAEVTEGSDVRLAYGDPETILESIRQDGQGIADFLPDVIQTFSCAARRAFWGDKDISKETVHFNNIASTSGYYTGGEFLRVDGVIRHFNITLVFAAMREGEPEKDREVTGFAPPVLRGIDEERIPLIQRFVSFIEASTAEFEDLNNMLIKASITDGLTGLYNRTEIERRIRTGLEERKESGIYGDVSIIMIDIDDFKHINDAYGHQEGDWVIIALSDVLREVLSEYNASLGRWGGEEFMVLLPDCDIDKAAEIAEKIRTEFASVSHEYAENQTVSLGVTQARETGNADTLYRRVDKALYMAKENGKNQVVKLK